MQLFPTKAARVIAGEMLRGAGRDLLTLRPEAMRRVRGREVAMIFQDAASYLNPVLTVGRAARAAAPGARHGRGAEARVAELLRDVGLSPEVAKRYPHELSGGQCQRVGIASALACRPGARDRRRTHHRARRHHPGAGAAAAGAAAARARVALLLITHDLGVVAEVCDRVYVMYAGQIVEEAPVERLFAEPQHPYTQGLLAGVLDLLDPKPIQAAIKGSVPDLRDPPSGCRFHPRCPHAMPRCSTDAAAARAPTERAGPQRLLVARRGRRITGSAMST
jgi:peptide/nickel transport system ATP-binding protein